MTFERDNIARMQGYTYGEQPDRPTMVKLNTNENPYPPSPRVAAALQSFDPARLRIYPNAVARDFCAAAAELNDIGIDNVMATNGGDEALRLAITTFVDPGATFGSVVPSYSLYPVLAGVQDCKRLEVPLCGDFSWPEDLAEQLNDADAKLTCIVNPHAPSGLLTDAATIMQLAERLNGVLLVDEAYVNFVNPESGHDLAPRVLDTDNLLILRSMSKGYSLAGLRFGYLMGHAQLIKPMLEKTRDSYNVDGLAQVLAQAALTDTEYSANNWRTICASRDALRKRLLAMGFSVPVSEGNYLLAQSAQEHELAAPELLAGLRERDIFVRYFKDLPDRLRITVGTEEENEALINALRELLGNVD